MGKRIPVKKSFVPINDDQYRIGQPVNQASFSIISDGINHIHTQRRGMLFNQAYQLHDPQVDSPTRLSGASTNNRYYQYCWTPGKTTRYVYISIITAGTSGSRTLVDNRNIYATSKYADSDTTIQEIVLANPTSFTGSVLKPDKSFKFPLLALHTGIVKVTGSQENKIQLFSGGGGMYPRVVSFWACELPVPYIDTEIDSECGFDPGSNGIVAGQEIISSSVKALAVALDNTRKNVALPIWNHQEEVTTAATTATDFFTKNSGRDLKWDVYPGVKTNSNTPVSVSCWVVGKCLSSPMTGSVFFTFDNTTISMSLSASFTQYKSQVGTIKPISDHLVFKGMVNTAGKEFVVYSAGCYVIKSTI